MNKGFSSQYFGNDEKEIEGMISLLCYIVLAEIIGKQRGFTGTHMVREYINATIIPGTISCLEWWAVETFTFLVGAMPLILSSKLNIFFVHTCWASLLLIFQMPMLGLSVAMAAVMTADIRNGRFYPAWYI